MKSYTTIEQVSGFATDIFGIDWSIMMDVSGTVERCGEVGDALEFTNISISPRFDPFIEMEVDSLEQLKGLLDSKSINRLKDYAEERLIEEGVEYMEDRDVVRDSNDDEKTQIALIIEGNGITYKPDDEDASLIAAAPELLEACLEAMDFIDGDYRGPANHLRVVLGKAINKAEGESL